MSQEGTLNLKTNGSLSSFVKRTLSLLVIFIAASTFLFADEETEQKVNTVTFTVAGETKIIKTIKPTVQQVLWQEMLVLSSLDRCYPPLQTPVTDGMTITVDRVKCDISVVQVIFPFETITRYAPHLAEGQSQILEQGKDGVMEEITKTWYLNGVETQSTTSSNLIASKPAVIFVGGTAPSRGMSIRRSISVVATAYEPGPVSCGKDANGLTATGVKAERGIIAVDPKFIPLGTKVYIEGYGFAVANDIGGNIKENRIDLCMDTVEECLQWGRRTVTMHIFD